MTQPQLSPNDDEQRPDQRTVDAAISAAEAAANPMTEWTCRNGAVVTLKRVPQTLLADIAMRVAKPKPPMVVVDEESGRTEPNPDHPDYGEELLQWAFDRTEAAFAAAIAYGVRVKELPEGMVEVDDDQWIEDLELVNEATGDEGVDVLTIAREPKGKRFYHYMRYYLLDDDIDLFAVSRVITFRTALTEEEVMAHVESFRYLVINDPDRIGDVAGWANPNADPLAPALTGDDLGI